jgi:hypothetical protein
MLSHSLVLLIVTVHFCCFLIIPIDMVIYQHTTAICVVSPIEAIFVFYFFCVTPTITIANANAILSQSFNIS